MRMQAAIMFQQGLPRPYATSTPLVIEDVELEGPGPGEVLIEIAAAGLCHSDLSAIEGIRPRPLPVVIGHEGAGIVREVGPGVTDLKPDDHVITVFVASCGACRNCVRGRPEHLQRRERGTRRGHAALGRQADPPAEWRADQPRQRPVALCAIRRRRAALGGEDRPRRAAG